MAHMTSDSGLHEALRRLSSRDMLVVPETTGDLVSRLVDFAKLNPEKAEHYEAQTRDHLEMAYGYAPDDDEERKPFVYSDGVAVIPIHGTLINRFNGSWGFVTGYNYVRRMLNLALDDDDVELIVFDTDSPGGEAAGCFELAREIMASRRVKPSLAMVDSTAASGGIALACCATQMYAIPSARIGSIGVYRMHVSYEEMFKDAGIEITFAAAGAHKVDGNPYQKLPKDVLKDWEQAAGRTWDDFIALVAEARDLTPDAVRATEAQVYRADDALDLGLIDAVKTPTEAVSAFLAELADGEPSSDDDDGDVHMADVKTKPEVTSGLTAADLSQISSMITSGITAAVGGLQRVQAIKDHAAAKGQVALGAKLAANAAISTEDAIGMIDDAASTVSAAAPKKPKKQKVAAADEGDDDEDGDDNEADDEDGDDNEADDEDGDDNEEDDGGEAAADAARKKRVAAKKGGAKAKSKKRGDRVNHFSDAMNASDHPNVGAGAGKGKLTGDAAISASILADHNKMTGAAWSGKTKQ